MFMTKKQTYALCLKICFLKTIGKSEAPNFIFNIFSYIYFCIKIIIFLETMG